MKDLGEAETVKKKPAVFHHDKLKRLEDWEKEKRRRKMLWLRKASAGVLCQTESVFVGSAGMDADLDDGIDISPGLFLPSMSRLVDPRCREAGRPNCVVQSPRL